MELLRDRPPIVGDRLFVALLLGANLRDDSDELFLTIARESSFAADARREAAFIP